MRLPRAEAEAWRLLDDQYVTATGNAEHDLAAVITWADDTGFPTPGLDPDAIRAARLSAALQSDVSRDSQGRLVRNRYSKEVGVQNEEGEFVQRTLWANFHQASDLFREASLRQRRHRTAQDVNRLIADLDRTNDDRSARGIPLIQMTFNFDVPLEDDDYA